MHDGPKLTRALAKRLGGFEALGRKLGTSGRCVQNYADGKRLPRPRIRVELEALGIPSGAWPAGRGSPASASAGPAAASRSIPAPAAVTIPASGSRKRRGTPAAAPASAQSEDARAIIIENLTALRARLDSASPEDVPQVAQAITSACRLLARISGQLELGEPQIVRSAPWQRVRTAMVEVLKPYPEALQAVAAAMERLGE